MFNLCYGMKYVNLSQLPESGYSHPNQAIDLCGIDVLCDVWRAVGFWKCVAVNWGYHTCFFTSCDKNGNFTKVRCADGKDRIITLAMTHSNYKYHTPVKNKIYRDGEIMYEEGNYGGSNMTGNHIHLEIASGVQTTKHWSGLKQCYMMNNELPVLKYMFVCRERSQVIDSKGVNLPVCYNAEYKPGIYVPKGKDMYLDIIAKKERLNIRRKLTFSGGKNTSEILYQIPKGARAAITHFTERFEEDGYEWAQVLIEVDDKKIEGYVQLDMKSYIIKTRRE